MHAEQFAQLYKSGWSVWLLTGENGPFACTDKLVPRHRTATVKWRQLG